ncbi:hypothetical protein HYT57_00520 [Candidatus Woesearchaeota archaeon]|nr:hypothetical protein [Candidatus Woesearchaeota archaeon]
MRSLKKFEEFVSLKIVKKQSSDKERAKNLIAEAEDKLKFFEKLKDRLSFGELNPNYTVETCYDILIELLRAKLIREGYKTDSHEAEVSYLRDIGFQESEVLFMNQLRYFRNGIKYYGKIFDEEYAKKVEKFLYSSLKKLKEPNEAIKEMKDEVRKSMQVVADEKGIKVK